MPRLFPDELAEWSAGEWIVGRPTQVTSIVHDTRQITPGSLFVAIPGARVDGHDLLSEASSRGAVAAMISSDRVNKAGQILPCIVVENTVKGLGNVAAGYRRRLGIRIVGVTGSVGKTTVKEMIAGMLATTFATARTKGNWNNEIGLPLSILQMPEDTDMGVIELGISHPGEMAPLCDIAGPNWGVITNVGPVHLEFFSSVEAIAREKGVLLASLPPDGCAVISADEVNYELLKRMSPCRVVSVSLKGAADYAVVAMDAGTGVNRVLERESGETFEFKMPLPGVHNLHNALLAMAVARGCGVTWGSIEAALGHYEAPPMRWQKYDVGGITLINDAYNANPLSMRASIRTFAEMNVRGKRWLVLGDMRELGAGEVAEHEDVGRWMRFGDWQGLVTVGRLGLSLADGAVEAGMEAGRVMRCDAPEAAADHLLAELKPGDAVLFKASRGVHLEVAVERILAELNNRG